MAEQSVRWRCFPRDSNGLTGYGNDGGDGGNQGGSFNVWAAGGGSGGAGGAGTNGSGATPGTGGAGRSNSFSGAAVTYAAGVSAKGSGGNTSGSDGTANTGNGGEGARMNGGSATDITGGDGGSGIVIVRWSDNSGDSARHTITANGDATNQRPQHHNVTANGDAHLIGPKVGTSLIAQDGTGDYLSLSDHADWDFSGQFTIEGWFNWNSFHSSITGDLIGSATNAAYLGASKSGWVMGTQNTSGDLTLLTNLIIHGYLNSISPIPFRRIDGITLLYQEMALMIFAVLWTVLR